ncbi:glycosyltransferase [Rhizobium puerariae]|uniref:Glycosyltransferase n=1 Tax=Rhizobium puerariae TaxID=1585791 RepID=A0ABV6AI38_9HYPH
MPAGDPRTRSVCFVVTSASRLGAGVMESARSQATGMAGAASADISVITLADRYSREDAGAWQGVRVTAVRPWGPSILGFSPFMLPALLRSGADVVHVHGVWQFHCLMVWLWSRITGRPYVVSPHGMLDRWLLKRSPFQKKMASVIYHNRFLRAAAGFHVLTRQEEKDVAPYADGGALTAVVPNYVTEPVPDGEGTPPWWRSGYEGKTVFLFLGRLHEKKGCMELCRSWSIACRSDPEFKAGAVLVFCGWIDGLPGFETEIASLGAELGNVFYAGAQYGADKQRSFAAADFFLLPSKSEGLPMAVLEAWAAGLPVLMTAACNLPEGFAAGAAIEVDLEPESLSRSLQDAFARAPAERDAMGEAGRTLVHAKFSRESVVPAVLNIYENILGPE